MSYAVEVQDLTVRYGRTTALDGVSLTIRPGTITGLIGRNGSGKTTLLSVLAAFRRANSRRANSRRANSGTVLVDGEDPWENERVVAGTCLVRESGDLMADSSMRDNLAYVEGARPYFSREVADRLMDAFELEPRIKPSALSRGKRSAFGIVVGVASRAPLTLLDEVHLGLDAPSRFAFYDALIADYVEHPRTIVLSSHLVEEIQRLIEDVVIVHQGTVLLAQDADTLRARGVSVTGPADAVERFVEGRRVLRRRQLGRTAEVTVDGALAPAERAAADDLGLELGPVDLQSLFVHLTEREAVR